MTWGRAKSCWKAKLLSDTLNEFHETVRQQSDVANKSLDMGIERVNQLAVEIRDVHRLMMRTLVLITT